MGLSQILVREIEPELTIEEKITSTTSSTKNFSISFPSYPVVAKSNGIRIYGNMVRVGQYFPFNHKGKQFLLHRPKEGTLEIYEVL